MRLGTWIRQVYIQVAKCKFSAVHGCSWRKDAGSTDNKFKRTKAGMGSNFEKRIGFGGRAVHLVSYQVELRIASMYAKDGDDAPQSKALPATQTQIFRIDAHG